MIEVDASKACRCILKELDSSMFESFTGLPLGATPRLAEATKKEKRRKRKKTKKGGY